MYLCVRGIECLYQASSEWSCICVLGVMYLCVRGIEYLCVRGHVSVC